MQQYFLKRVLTVGQEVELSQEIAHHLGHVLRKKEGAEIRLVDAQGQVFRATLFWQEKRLFALVCESLAENRETPAPITLFLSFIKREKWEYSLQKCTELGVTRLIAVATARSVVSLDAMKKRRARYEKILEEAAEQSERHKVPVLDFAADFTQLTNPRCTVNFICTERAAGVPHLIEALQEELPLEKQMRSVSVFVGPEGGFTVEEIAQAKAMGFRSVTLGPRILRAETAASTAVALIAAHMERQEGEDMNKQDKKVDAIISESEQKNQVAQKGMVSGTDVYGDVEKREEETGVEIPTEDAVLEAKEWSDLENRS